MARWKYTKDNPVEVFLSFEHNPQEKIKATAQYHAGVFEMIYKEEHLATGYDESFDRIKPGGIFHCEFDGKKYHFVIQSEPEIEFPPGKVVFMFKVSEFDPSKMPQ